MCWYLNSFQQFVSNKTFCNCSCQIISFYQIKFLLYRSPFCNLDCSMSFVAIYFSCLRFFLLFLFSSFPLLSFFFLRLTHSFFPRYDLVCNNSNYDCPHNVMHCIKCFVKMWVFLVFILLFILCLSSFRLSDG